jgi:hypothetical protein
MFILKLKTWLYCELLSLFVTLLRERYIRLVKIVYNWISNFLYDF